MIDENLVIEAKSGDKDAFTKLYSAVSTDLYKLALYTLGNTHDAEDVVSETFIEAYKCLKNLRDTKSFKAWIMRILSFRCKRKIGEYVKGKNTFDIEDFIHLPSLETDIAEHISEKSTVFSALEEIQPKDRLIVMLSVLGGYTTKEISQILVCPHGTISSKLHRTLLKLRKILERSGE